MPPLKLRWHVWLPKRPFPFLGICGGMQSINVALGGNLYQDILSQIPRSRQHLQTTKATRMAHSIEITPRSLLRSILRQGKVRVNSSHHQSVKDVASIFDDCVPPLPMALLKPSNPLDIPFYSVSNGIQNFSINKTQCPVAYLRRFSRQQPQANESPTLIRTQASKA